jgi:hypothetical protein
MRTPGGYPSKIKFAYNIAPNSSRGQNATDAMGAGHRIQRLECYQVWWRQVLSGRVSSSPRAAPRLNVEEGEGWGREPAFVGVGTLRFLRTDNYSPLPNVLTS